MKFNYLTLGAASKLLYAPVDDFGFDGGGSSSGDNPDGDNPDGDEPDGDVINNGNPDGDNPDGDEPDGDVINNGNPDGDKPDDLDEPDDGDKPDGDGKGQKDIEITEGQVIEIGEDSYTVDKDKNLIDKDGNIFKEAKDVQEFLKSFTIDDNDDESTINITNIQKTLGIDLTDENDKPLEFENSLEGISSYVKSVIDAQKQEVADAAVNSLFEKFPIVKDVLTYYIANGNSLDGFGEMPDRSNITIDDANEAQQESIIRTSWKENSRTGDVDAYINYLKSAGILAETAKTELAGLQAADKAKKEQYAKQAEAAEKEHAEQLKTYWSGVQSVIEGRKIAGYQIPEQIIRTVDGKKFTSTPKDFFNYLYQTNDKGYSRYELDLAKLTPEQRRDDEILRAYLMFAGGSYSNLVDMQIAERQVANLKLKAKEQKQSTSRIRFKNPSKPNNETYGY